MIANALEVRQHLGIEHAGFGGALALAHTLKVEFAVTIGDVVDLLFQVGHLLQPFARIKRRLQNLQTQYGP